MTYNEIKSKLNKVFESMVSTAAGLPGIEGGMTVKKKIIKSIKKKKNKKFLDD